MSKVRRAANTTTLTSLAILKVDIDEGRREYLDYLVTFVVEALAKRKPEVVSAVVVSNLLTEEFGLRIPTKAVQLVLRKIVKTSKLLEYRDGSYFLKNPFPAPSMEGRRVGARNHIDAVIDGLCDFSASIGINPSWTPDHATQAIISFLSRFTVECLKTFVFDTALPKVTGGTKEDHYVVGRFVTDAYESNKSLFNSFIVLVKGQMYANALTCPDLESLNKKFSTLTVYLDTPVILNLLGLHGEEYALAANELVGLIRELKGAVRVFSHTVDEVLGVIRFSVEHYDDVNASNRLLREIRSANKPKSDLLLIAGNIESLLKDLHVRVDHTPQYSTQFQIDEAAFREALQEEIQYLGNQAVNQDVNSVRSIYVKRQGSIPSRLEDAVAIFVTSNASFARAAFEQGRNHNSSREVSPVITDFSLSNIAWLKAPMKKPELPEREALAMCYAALEPSAALLEKYVRSMDEMRLRGEISEEDHAILRASSVAQLELMNLTRGDDEAFSKQSITTILEKAKSSLVVDLAARHEGELNERAQENSVLTAALFEAEGKAQKSDAVIDRYKKRFERIADGIAKYVIYVLFFIISLALLIGGVFGAGLRATPDSLRHPLLSFAVTAFVVVAVVFSWYSLLSGKSVAHLVNKSRSWLAAFIMRKLSGDTKS